MFTIFLILLIGIVIIYDFSSKEEGRVPVILQFLNLAAYVNDSTKIHIKVVAIFLRKHGTITAKQNEFLLEQLSTLYILPKNVIMQKIAQEVQSQKLHHIRQIDIPHETHKVRIHVISFIFRLSKTGKSTISTQDLLILEEIREYLKITRLVYQKIKNVYVKPHIEDNYQNIPPKKIRNYNVDDALATLCLTNKASLSEVKKSFRRLAKKYHPDLHKRNNLSKEYATKKIIEITQAYNFLINWLK